MVTFHPGLTDRYLLEMEEKDAAYHRRVRAGYLDIARRDHKRVKVINAAGTIEEIQEMVRHEVDRVI